MPVQTVFSLFFILFQNIFMAAKELLYRHKVDNSGIISEIQVR